MGSELGAPFATSSSARCTSSVVKGWASTRTFPALGILSTLWAPMNVAERIPSRDMMEDVDRPSAGKSNLGRKPLGGGTGVGAVAGAASALLAEKIGARFGSSTALDSVSPWTPRPTGAFQ